MSGSSASGRVPPATSLIRRARTPSRNPRGASPLRPGASVRDAALDVLRTLGSTAIFANPGSTEVPLLTNLPESFRFVLGLHEGAVVGMATGWAIARDSPALVILHTTAGLGNAVGALATARVNRAPLVVLVGQQDRRHLAFEPFLAGSRLDLLGGDYPVWVDQPVRPQDVPGALARAHQEAEAGGGPAVVIVPMDDWEAPRDRSAGVPAPDRVFRAREAPPEAIAALASLVEEARDPAIVVGAGADDRGTWSVLVALAERLGSPVWQEAFGARAGFPQDHRLFAGHLPAGRSALRDALARHDLVVAVGAPAFRQYAYEPGRFLDEDTRVAVVTEHAEEAHRSPADVAVVASPRAVCAALLRRVEARDAAPLAPAERAPAPFRPAAGEPLRAGHVLAAIAERLPEDAIVVEETPSSRAELHARIPARQPLGFVSAAMGGLGFAMPAAIGLRMALPERPVLAVVGDGSSLYAIQSLWSAARYGIGALFVVLSNGGYAIMDQLAARQGGAGPWPDLDDIDVCLLARGLACDARRVDRYEDLLEALDSLLPTLAGRRTPLVLDVSTVACHRSPSAATATVPGASAPA